MNMVERRRSMPHANSPQCFAGTHRRKGDHLFEQGAMEPMLGGSLLKQVIAVPLPRRDEKAVLQGRMRGIERRDDCPDDVPPRLS